MFTYDRLNTIMRSRNNNLCRNKCIMMCSNNVHFKFQKLLTLPKTGLYSIHLSAYDKAGNYRSARRLVLYDSQSHISHNPNKQTRADSGAKNTNYTWVVNNTSVIKIAWSGRFRNVLHDQNKWLNRMSPSHDISNLYDDFTGIITVKGTKNVYGEFVIQDFFL